MKLILWFALVERLVGGKFLSFQPGYPTAQADIDRLVKAKILMPLRDVRPKAYFSPEIFRIAFAEQDTLFEQQTNIQPELEMEPA
jgi:hypothetical protein